MQINKYVLKNLFLFFIILFVFGWLMQQMQIQQIQLIEEPFVSEIREGYRASMRGTRNIVRDIYKYGYLYTSKMLRI